MKINIIFYKILVKCQNMTKVLNSPLSQNRGTPKPYGLTGLLNTLREGNYPSPLKQNKLIQHQMIYFNSSNPLRLIGWMVTDRRFRMTMHSILILFLEIDQFLCLFFFLSRGVTGYPGCGQIKRRQHFLMFILIAHAKCLLWLWRHW